MLLLLTTHINMLSFPLGKLTATIMSLLPQYILHLMEASDLHRAISHHVTALVEQLSLSHPQSESTIATKNIHQSTSKGQQDTFLLLR